MKTAIFTNVDADIIQGKLERFGANVTFERQERVHVYDYEDLRLSKEGAWLRLTDEGERVTLSYREKLSQEKHHHKAEEVDIQLDNFNGMNFIMRKMGLVLQFVEEKRRLQYAREQVKYTFEYMPGINPYLEINAPNEEAFIEAATELDLNPDDAKTASTYQIYQEAGININEYSELSFAHMKKR